MRLVRAAVSEVIRLFVDDGALALLSAILIALVAGAVKLLAVPPLDGAFVLLIGAIAILADSIRRAARKRVR